MAQSSGQPMECEAALTRLLDLVYDELESDEVSSVRAHVESCDGCTRALARLEGGRAVARKMELAEPPAGALDAVMAAARARAAEAARDAPPVPREIAPEEQASVPSRREPRDEPERSWWSDLFRWLGSMAMGPQVAMATLLLLMIGIGLWSIPALRGRGPTTTAVLEPDMAGEAGPSASGVQPAEPLAFDFDPRTRRLAPIDDDGEPIAVAPTPRPATVAERRASAPIERTEPGAGAAGPAQPATTTPEVAEAEEDERDALALAGVEEQIAPGESVGSVMADPLPPVRDEPGVGTTAAATMERPVAPSVAPAAAAEQRARVYRGVEDGAFEATAPDTDTLMASALMQQARAAAARGAHAECVQQYGRLTTRYPRHGEIGRALVEMAECQRRMGRLTEAARTLERAQQHAAVRADATRELARVRMQERATEPPLREPAAEAASD